MKHYRMFVEFKANDLDDAWDIVGQHCDWGGQPSKEEIEKNSDIKLEEIEDACGKDG